MGIVSRSQSGGSGIGAVLFDSTLGAPAASIDTGAGGIAQTQNVLEVWVIARTDDAGAAAQVDITVNNDGGANYDAMNVAGVNATASAGNALAQTFWQHNVHGAGGLASAPGIVRLTIPGYTQTTLFKVGESVSAAPDSVAANNKVIIRALTWRSTAAITRMKVAAEAAANLATGSRLLILGR